MFAFTTTSALAQEEDAPTVTLYEAFWGLALFLVAILVLAYIGSRR